MLGAAGGSEAPAVHWVAASPARGGGGEWREAPAYTCVGDRCAAQEEDGFCRLGARCCFVLVGAEDSTGILSGSESNEYVTAEGKIEIDLIRCGKETVVMELDGPLVREGEFAPFASLSVEIDDLTRFCDATVAAEDGTRVELIGACDGEVASVTRAATDRDVTVLGESTTTALGGIEVMRGCGGEFAHAKGIEGFAGWHVGEVAHVGRAPFYKTRIDEPFCGVVESGVQDKKTKYEQ